MWKSLYLFEPETAHAFAMKSLTALHAVSPAAVRALCGVSLENNSEKKVAGLTFKNRLGLAAGFDKNAEYVDVLQDCGFGFIEIGTVTPKAQPGNDRPRLYRDLKEKKLFNRMGFNNEGAEKVAQRLSQRPAERHSSLVLGVNIGKNKDTPNDEAQRDYRECARILAKYSDYMVLNVSSPNTPGLRELQSVENLSKIVTEVMNELQKVTKTVPLFIKLAPELDQKDFERLFSPLESLGISGWVLTNTLGGVDPWKKNLSGGWSGSVLTQISYDRLKLARSYTVKPIISVGGIMTPEDAVARLKAGADLIQIYSGWILNGPQFTSKILEKTAKI